MNHVMKLNQAVFAEVENGMRLFIVTRAGDRIFKGGDRITFHEFNADAGDFTGKTSRTKIANIHTGEDIGISGLDNDILFISFKKPYKPRAKSGTQQDTLVHEAL